MVPLLHRVAANLCNTMAQAAQEAVRNHMEDSFNIRKSGGRFGGFILQQVKIPKFAYAKDFPNILCELRIDANAAGSPRAVPLLLGEMEGGPFKRAPFVGKRWAWPSSYNARVGGTFEGRVKSGMEWENLGLGHGPVRKMMTDIDGSPSMQARRYSNRFWATDKDGMGRINKRGGAVIKGSKNFYLVRPKGGAGTDEYGRKAKFLVFQHKRGNAQDEVIYHGGPAATVKQLRKTGKYFLFFDTAVDAIWGGAHAAFDDLMANNGQMVPF
jgi:hypothetical protein